MGRDQRKFLQAFSKQFDLLMNNGLFDISLCIHSLMEIIPISDFVIFFINVKQLWIIQNDVPID